VGLISGIGVHWQLSLPAAEEPVPTFEAEEIDVFHGEIWVLGDEGLGRDPDAIGVAGATAARADVNHVVPGKLPMPPTPADGVLVNR
jgi:hypothetical protein